MGDVTIEPLSGPFTAVVRPPGSKSLTNRALVLASLAKGSSTLGNVLFADDTRVMLEGLSRLGFTISIDAAACIVGVSGAGGALPAAEAELFCGNSGTTIRFLTALCSLGHGRYRLDGVERMRQRPIGELVNGLNNLGVRTEYAGQVGFPPVIVDADGIAGGLLTYGTAASSQFLSAVAMISPFARHEVRIELEGRQTSWPYVVMTMRLMDEFGVTPELIRDPITSEPRCIVIPRGVYHAVDYAVEPDASNATYFLAAAAINPGSKVTIQGLGRGSLQGDVGFADVLHRMGANLIFGRDFITLIGPERLEGIDVDLFDMPDTAQTLAVVALFAEGPTHITGLRSLRVKETDRLAALCVELAALGAAVNVEDDDTLQIDPPVNIQSAAIATYDDHRMAMSFALAATRRNGIVIRDGHCVNKTYPDFFGDFRKMLESRAST
jgi:3-phosphoshikimate 1-carboxyvinyltransferase